MRAWVEVEMTNLVFNIGEIKKKVGDSEVIAVVKADSYGFGMVEITKYLSKHNINVFAVACLDEALELRKNGITKEILVLGPLFLDEIEEACKNHIQITIGNWEQIKFIEEKKLNVGIHIKIDTGMGRIGFDEKEGERVVEYCLEKKLNLKGVYSHLSSADIFDNEADEYTKTQLKKFEIFKKYENSIKYIHILNSGGILRFNDFYKGNAIRAGICMYGMLGNEKIKDFKDVFTVKTKVLAFKRVEENSFISYGRTYTLEKGEMFATLGMGYADGMKKKLSNKGYVIIEGEKCPIIGQICMDMCMVKIPNSIQDKINVGTEATVITADIIEGTNVEHKCSWDILTGIGKRVYRVYMENGKPYSIVR